MANSQTVSRLNELLVKNYDAKAGYNTAAEKVENDTLKLYLTRRSSEREDFSNHLKNEIISLGGTPEDGTSVTGDLHRAWIGLRDAFTAGDSSVYKECVRGENAFVEEYNEALTHEHIPTSIKSRIEEQLSAAQQAIAELEAMSEFA